MIEQNDEWLVGRRYLSEESMRLVLCGIQDRDDHPHQEDKEEVIELNAA